MSPVIDVHGLVKRFGARTVVDHVSIQVAQGQICGFLGPNGSGKTTTIRMLCGLLTPDEGNGTCLGHDIVKEAWAIKRQVGYMTQRFSLYEDLSIQENLDFVARLYAMDRRRERVAEALERLGLANRRDQLAGALSGGWKQRLALTAAVIHEPKLLLLDEPTAGVDPKARREFWDEIHRLAADGMTVLVSTHYMDEAERCHRIAYISYGRLLTEGTINEVLAASDLVTWHAEGQGIDAVADGLRGRPGVEMVAPFGSTLHVSGTDRQALEAAIAPWRAAPDLVWREIPALARGRVHPPHGRHAGQLRMSGRWFSFPRAWAVIVKEFIQMRRDRLTFAMMVGIPLMQLTLFGYAINTDPKHLPTVVLALDQSDFTRSFMAALQNTGYYSRGPRGRQPGGSRPDARRWAMLCSRSPSRRGSPATSCAATARSCWSRATPATRSPPAMPWVPWAPCRSGRSSTT